MKETTKIVLIATVGLVSMAAQAGLIHRYELNQDYDDSVGSANANPVGVGTAGYGEDALFNLDTPAGVVSGASAYSMQVGMSNGTKKSGMTAPGVLSTTATSGTISMWIKTTTAAADGTEDFVFLSYLASGTTQIDMDQGALTADAKIGNKYKGNALTLSDSSWDHVAMSWDSTGTGVIYVNGSVSYTTAAGDVNATPNSGDIRFGNKNMDNRNNGNLNNQFTGSYYDIQIYDEALASTDVSALYNNPGSVIPEPATMGLVGLSAVALLLFRKIGFIA